MEISWTWLGLCAAGLLIAACVLGFRKGFVKEVVSAFFMILSFLLVWVINPYVNSFLREYTPLYTTVQQSSQEFVESQTGNRKSVDRTEQSQIVENLNIPDLLKNKLKENNTAETYRYLAVNTFYRIYFRLVGNHGSKWNFFFAIICAISCGDKTAWIYFEYIVQSSCYSWRKQTGWCSCGAGKMRDFYLDRSADSYITVQYPDRKNRNGVGTKGYFSEFFV